MLANRIRKRDDQFELRGWTWHFHHIRDAGPMARLEYDTDEIQWLKLHGHKDLVEIRPGDLDHILPQIGYPVPTGKRRRAGEPAQEAGEPTQTQPSEPPAEPKYIEVPIDNPQDKAEIERLKEQLAQSNRERDEAARKASLASAEAEGAKAERDALKFQVEAEGPGFDKLPEIPEKDRAELDALARAESLLETDEKIEAVLKDRTRRERLIATINRRLDREDNFQKYSGERTDEGKRLVRLKDSIARYGAEIG